MKKMKKTTLSLLVFVLASSLSVAQTVEDGIRKLYYLRIRESVEILEKVVASKPSDPVANYWLGQAYIKVYSIAGYKDALTKAKDLYQKALNSGVNDPLIWVGMGHIELFEGNSASARQRFEQAITASTATKGKNKGKEDPTILNAIGAANVDGGSTQGDPLYAVEVLKKAAELNTTDGTIPVNLGIAYLKMGSDKGGEAVEAFMEASRRNPQSAVPYWRIGRIYQSQNNTEYMNEWYAKAIAADPAFGPVYLQYFNYYKEKDVNVAKEYLDKFIANSEQDCATDFFVADYLYRAGKNQESLAKAKEMENSACRDYVRLKVIYAYNYDKMGDSLTAKSYIESFFQQAPPDKVEPTDYIFAGNLLAKFPGSEQAAVDNYMKAAEIDTTRAKKLEYMNKAAALLGKAKMYDKQYALLLEAATLKGKITSTDYYYITKAALDGKNCAAADSMSRQYVANYPELAQGYSFNVMAAKMCDTDTSKGLAIEPINNYNTFLNKDREKNKKAIFNNQYYLLIFYAQYSKELEKAIQVCDEMISLYPDPASEENKFGTSTKDQLSKALQKKGGNGGASGKNASASGNK